MLVQSGENYLEVRVTDRGASGTPEAGDTRFKVRVRISGWDTVFTAESWCWVDLPALAAFAEQLRVLEERRQGAAVLESMSPGELRLEVRAIDRTGHVAACGQVGHHCYSAAERAHWSAIAFEIPFCPSELPALVREFSDLAVTPEA